MRYSSSAYPEKLIMNPKPNKNPQESTRLGFLKTRVFYPG